MAFILVFLTNSLYRFRGLLGPCQTSKMGIFAKVITESSTLDAWKGSEYTSSFLAANANLYEIFLQVISTSLC